jgi:probable F420-dependent oxidoreductase
VADVWTTIAHAARSTSRVKLATGVYILPLRDVFVTARAAASVQALSEGRFLFGVGTGWLKEEFEALGQPFEDRGARADELLDALGQLWRGEPIAYSGKHVSFEEVQFSPPAIPIPIIVGGTSKSAVQRAATYGDGWFAPSGSLEGSVRIRDAIDAQRQMLGRHGEFTYYVRPEGDVDEDVFERYADAGFSNVTISLRQLAVSPGSSLAERVSAVERAGKRFELTGG